MLFLGPATVLLFTLVPLTSGIFTSCPPVIGPAGVSARLPPSFNRPGSEISHWTPPPKGWYFQAWNMLHDSNPQYLGFRNFQYDPSPVNSSTDLVNDLGSFQLAALPPNSTLDPDAVYTTYGVLTPHITFPQVYHYQGTGLLENATSEYSMLAWGWDAAGVPYYALYSSETPQTGTPAAIDIMSLCDEGLDAGIEEGGTYDALVEAMVELGNEEIATLAGGMVEMIQDGGRDGLPRVTTCDAECKSNSDLEIIMPGSG